MEKSIYLDTKIFADFPFHSHDYNSKLVFNFLYEPLFVQTHDGSFKENIVTDLSSEEMIILRFDKGKRWSDGRLITATDYFNTLMYILENRTIFSRYLEFINGVKEYLDKDKGKDELGVYCSGNILYIIPNRMDSYKEIFSTIEFSPVVVKNGMPQNTITNGSLVPTREILKELSLLICKNNLFNQNNFFGSFDKITFWEEKSRATNINDFKNGKCLMTGTTIFRREDLIGLKKYCGFKSELTNIGFNLFFSKKIPLGTQLIIYNNLMDSLSEFREIIEIPKKSILLRAKKQRISEVIESSKDGIISIGYTDFYPNLEIIRKLECILSKLNIKFKIHKINLGEIIKSKTEFDILLDPSFKLVHNSLDNYIAEIPYIIELFSDEYIELLNKWLEGIINEHVIIEFIQMYSSRRSLGKFKSHALVNKFLNLRKDQNDNYSLIN